MESLRGDYWRMGALALGADWVLSAQGVRKHKTNIQTPSYNPDAASSPLIRLEPKCEPEGGQFMVLEKRAQSKKVRFLMMEKEYLQTDHFWKSCFQKGTCILLASAFSSTPPTSALPHSPPLTSPITSRAVPHLNNAKESASDPAFPELCF